MSEPKRPIDFAAIARVSSKPSPKKTNWLGVGKQICAPKHAQGVGIITTILGESLIAKFPSYSVPIFIRNWQEEIDRREISPPDGDAEITIEHDKQDISEIEKEIAAIRVTGHSEGESHPLPDDLPPNLQIALKAQGYTHLWSHQLQSLTAIRAGKDVLLATPTASGKTLSFLPAILETCIRDPQATALSIFPLKALAQDQMTKLEAIANPIGLRIGQMTGDVPMRERVKLFVPESPQILCFSPDVLHHQLNRIQYRQDWQGWRDFLARLRYVVIDEAHTYRGSFGGHFANLMRRLRLAVDRLGGNSDRIQYVLATATIGNPIELAQSFTERYDRLEVIDRSGAQTEGRTILCANPLNRTNSEASRYVLEWLDMGLSGIVFCNTRVGVKSLLALTIAELKRNKKEYLKHQLALFYGSINNDRRNEIVEGLRSGKVRVIFSTSALEAGIDLPELDCCLIRGYPGSLMSFYQRIGRAGRQRHGLVIFLPSYSDPLDYFYGKNPQLLLDGKAERALCNPNYHSILGKHLLCAASESTIPAAQIEVRFGSKSGAIAEELIKQKALRLNQNSDLCATGRPHSDVNMRGTAQDSIKLIDIKNNEQKEELSLIQAYREVFPNAIYAMQGNNGSMQYYRSRSLNLVTKRAELVLLSEEPKQSTQATQDMNIVEKESLREPRLVALNLDNCRLRLTLSWGEISNSVTGYQSLSKIRTKACTKLRCSRYHEPVSGDNCPICSSSTRLTDVSKVEKEDQFETPFSTSYEAPVLKVEMNLELAKPIQEYANQLKLLAEERFGKDIPTVLLPLFKSEPVALTLHSLCHQIGISMPMLVLCDRQDLNSYCIDKPERMNTSKTIAYFFDTTDGGNGTCEELFDHFETFAERACQLVEGCDCEHGCPRCLTDHHCPQNNQGLNKALGLFLLQAITNESEYF